MVQPRAQERTVKIAKIIAILLTVAIVIFAGYWLIVGQAQVMVVPEVPAAYPGPRLASRIFYAPYPPAAMYLATAVLVLVGVIKQKWLPVAWIGLAILFVWSVLFLFSSGAAVLAVVAVLFILLTIIQTRRLVYAWIELIVLLALSVLLKYDLASTLLSATGVLLIVLTLIPGCSAVRTVARDL